MKNGQKLKVIVGGLPEPAGSLSRGAREAWDSLAPEMHRAGLLTFANRIILADYCRAVDLNVEAHKVLDKSGLIKTLPNGDIRERPEVRTAHRSAMKMLRLGGKLGLTPMSRQRLVEKAQAKMISRKCNQSQKSIEWIDLREGNRMTVVMERDVLAALPGKKATFYTSFDTNVWITSIRELFQSDNWAIVDIATTRTSTAGELLAITVMDITGQVVLDTIIRPSGSIPSQATSAYGIDRKAANKAPSYAEIYPELKRLLQNKRIACTNENLVRAIFRQTGNKGFAPELKLRWLGFMHGVSAIRRVGVPLDCRLSGNPDGNYKGRQECEAIYQALKILRDTELVPDDGSGGKREPMVAHYVLVDDSENSPEKNGNGKSSEILFLPIIATIAVVLISMVLSVLSVHPR